ncbi:MAG: hypothetical protein E7425_11570 [Ruminococcaceae bacterium]|nr:hypothetical protein [Oscillospiraceae bacterium]
MIDRRLCAALYHSHFHGNGNCDAMREANKRMDHATGMESEIAPYAETESTGVKPLLPNGAAPGQMTPYGGTPTAPANSAAAGYDDPAYGPQHEWTTEEESGMNSLPQDNFNDPLSADEAARSSWRALLARNVGRNVLVRFLMGTQNFITVEGELYEVGTDYIVIYQPLWDSHITADLYSVKFVEFREPPGQVTLN